VTEAPTQVAYGPACEACGHRRRSTASQIPDDVAAMLRKAFAASGMTKSELARRAGLSTRGTFVARLLGGATRPSRPVARDLIVALDLSWTQGERLLAASGSERDRRTRRREVA
jgi:transcriptional regulator with XRE-family HTH domain